MIDVAMVTPTDTAPAAGSFIAARSSSDDIGRLLGSSAPADKLRLDELVVPESAWVAFMSAGLVDQWQELADGLLGPYEEAWFSVDALPRFRELAQAKRASLWGDALRVLDDAIALALKAAERGVPLVFAG